MKKSLGILGGMGPLATADLFTKIVQMTDAKRDNDHLRVYIDNNAQIPDRTAAILSGGADPVPAMAESAQKLASMGAELLIMPCNTAHYFLPRLREQCSVPFLNMIEITAERCRQTHGQAPAGLLATRGTIQTGLYRRALEAQGVPCVEPDEGVAHGAQGCSGKRTPCDWSGAQGLRRDGISGGLERDSKQTH